MIDPTAAMPAPRYGTPVNSGRPNMLGVYERLARTLGFAALLPWQRHAIKLATEVGDDGLPQYREVTISLPRQNGKSVLVGLVLLARMLSWPPDRGKQTVVLGAQDALAARRQLIDVLWPRIDSSGLADAGGLILRAGALVDVRAANGNHLYVLSSNISSGHGQTVNLAVLDEVWALKSDAAHQAIGPAQSTILDAQLWQLSTMGDDSAGLWRSQVERGRAECDVGKPTRHAYLEWSSADDTDADDPEVWRSANPAFGTELIPQSSIEAMRGQLSEPAFRRAVLNQQVANAVDRVIPALAWDAVQRPDAIPEGGVVFGVDAPPDRSFAAVVACDSAGRVEVLAHRAGIGWVANFIAERMGHPDALGVAALTGGPLAGELDPWRRRRVPVFGLSSALSAVASGRFYDAVVAGRVEVRPQAGLTTAVAAGIRRPLGTAWVWGRSSPDLDVSPLVAASLAFHVATAEADKLVTRVVPSVVDLGDGGAMSAAERAEYDAEVMAWRKVGV